jgi:hypothetical protein
MKSLFKSVATFTGTPGSRKRTQWTPQGLGKAWVFHGIITTDADWLHTESDLGNGEGLVTPLRTQSVTVTTAALPLSVPVVPPHSNFRHTFLDERRIARSPACLATPIADCYTQSEDLSHSGGTEGAPTLHHDGCCQWEGRLGVEGGSCRITYSVKRGSAVG